MSDDEKICPICQSHDISVEIEEDETTCTCQACGHIWEE